MPFKKGDPKPKNSGRKKGSMNKRSLEDLYAMCEASGVEPFQVLLDLTKDRDSSIRLGAAKEAAKYIYTQRRATEISGPNGQPIQTEVEASDQLQELLADLKVIVDTKVNERKG
jgi:hypothetical protein